MCRSTRLRELFLYLCARVLDDGAQDIHELEVGHKVFGRPQQYDTTADNIVRVHASMLRKRLTEFFDNDGRDETFTIEIPRGNYAPLFIERKAARKLSIEAEEPNVKTLIPIPGYRIEPAGLPEPAPAPAIARFRAWALPVVSFLAVAFFALSVFLFLNGNWLRRNLQHGLFSGKPTVRQFWTGLFPESEPTEVVFDDASLDFYQEATGHEVALAEYFDRSYLSSVEATARRSKMDPTLVHSLMLRRQSFFADSALAWRMSQIAGELHSSANVQFARDLTFRQLKAGNIILLGNPQSNPWIQPFESRLSIVWVLDPELHSYYPRDKTLPASQQDQFRTAAIDGNAHEGLASISYFPNTSGSGNVLILSASGGSAMGTALDFLSSETSMNQLRVRLPKSRTSGYPYFDVLIKTPKGSKDLSSVIVAICHPIAFPATQNP